MFLVVGATGELGSRVTRRLLADGRQVRCLVRDGTDTTALRETGAELVVGDLTDPATLQPACTGVETVVATATVIARELAGTRRPTLRDVDRDGMLALVEAAEDAGVERFVYLSYAGVEATFGTPLEEAKRAVEERLVKSPMRSVLVRPDAFQEVHLAPLGRFDVAQGKVMVIGHGDNPVRWVAIDDVASLVAAVAVEEDPPARVEFGGPEALTRNEAVAVAERATGRRVRVRHVPRAAVRLAVPLLSRLNDAVATVLGIGLMQDETPVSWDDAPLRQRGISPRPATAWIEAQAAAH